MNQRQLLIFGRVQGDTRVGGLNFLLWGEEANDIRIRNLGLKDFAHVLLSGSWHNTLILLDYALHQI